MRLLLAEATAAFAAAWGAILLWRLPQPIGAAELAASALEAVAPAACMIFAFCFAHLYDLRVVRRLGDCTQRLPQAISLGLLLLVAFYFAVPQAKMSGGPFVSSLLAVLAAPMALRALRHRMLRSRPFAERALVLGACPFASSLVCEIESRPELGYSIEGIVDDECEAQVLRPRYKGRIEELGRIVEALRPDRIIVAMTTRRGRLPVQQLLALRFAGIAVDDGVAVYERLTGKLAIERITPSSLIFCDHLRPSRLHEALSRGVSLAAAAVGLVLTAPLFALIALAVKIDSRGPVFFLHRRVGAGGRRFDLIKFRTMHPALKATSEWVRDNGDRITRVGRFLRRFRLDELPQFVNVLHGDMNLVGPRPHPVANFELFAEKIPYYSLRSAIRPGITGWAQVRYVYANNLVEETEKMRYDLYYIKHMSLWLDLRILLETVKIVLLGREQPAVGGYQQPAAAA
jgi:exopolysaccharide biosynthesis polyprenyl glycosylphosphotransferase